MPDMTSSTGAGPENHESADARRSATRRDETPPPYEPPTHETALPGETSRVRREATEDSGHTTQASDTPLPTTPGPTSTNGTKGTNGTNGTHGATGTTAGPHDDRSTSSLLPDKSSLLPDEECDRIASRMRHAVVGFVDGPRAAVAEADEVLEELAGQLTEVVDRRRRTLRGTWHQEGGAKAGGGKDRGPAAATAVDTEQLRLALRDYRELTERLLRL
jgi:hypothetical protein